MSGYGQIADTFLTGVQFKFTIEMDELAGGRKFTDFKSLSAAVAQFENSNFAQFYKRDSRSVEEDVLLLELHYLFHIIIYLLFRTTDYIL